MKLTIITSNRADWGLLKPLVNKLKEDSFFNLSVLATGSHLSPQHGYTVKDIDVECLKTEILLSSDTALGACKSLGLACISISEILSNLNPDLVLVLGDRQEIFAAAQVAYTLGIKIAHLHGGEVSGNTDDVWRDCISRMSYLHLPATENAKYRLESVGRKNVFCVGALGCEGLKRREKDLGYLVVIYHPNTLEKENFGEVLHFLRKRPESKIFITANSDPGGYEINKAINRFAEYSPSGTLVYDHVERSKFIAFLSTAKVIIGNSSCGIIEAPSLGVPTINIGSRQKGRARASSVIDCDCEDIEYAFKRIDTGNYHFGYIPYQGGDVAERIVNILKEIK